MNLTRCIRRLPLLLAVLAAAVVALVANTTAASAVMDPPIVPPSLIHLPRRLTPAIAHTDVSAGIPAWQIALIAAGAALLAAALTVLVHRLRAARRRPTVSGA